MLHYPESNVRAEGVAALGQKPEPAEFIDLDRIFAMVRRQMWVVVLGLLAGLILGVIYLLTAVPYYTASADILIDKGQSKLVDQLASASGVFQDEAEMLSQVELLKSDQIAEAVATRLNLLQNPVFMTPPPSLKRTVINGVRSLVAGFAADIDESLPPAPPTISDAAAVLQSNLDVSRVGQTYVLRLDYTSVDPVLSQAIASAFGEAYLDDQLQAKYEATRRASGWLQDRIAELKQQSYNADLAVQEFRNANNLIVSTSRVTGDVLVSQQQLGEITSQLVAAEASTAAAKAKLDQIRDIIRKGDPNAVVDDALSSTTINGLREKYLDAARREAEITKKLGPEHAQAVRLRGEMMEYQRLILGELSRIAESYESAYRVALSRQDALRTSLSDIVNVNAGANTTQVKLRELEREAETFKSLYDNFLQRYQQTIQQQSFPITDARIISPPTLPASPSAPKRPLVLALFMILGVAASAGVAGLREYRERFFRVGDQVRSELDCEFLGYAPAIRSGSDGDSGDTSYQSRCWAPDSVMTHVRRRPMSAFAETLRNVKIGADMAMPDLPTKVIGIISCVPGEGKSTISGNLAHIFAMQGSRTVLVDGDLRNPGLTRSLAERPENGFIDLALGQSDLNDTLIWEEENRLAVIPTVLKRRVSNTSEVLASVATSRLITQLRSEFEYILVDLPPVGPVVDAKAFSPRVDAFVFVIEWGRTSRQLARSIIAHNPIFRQKCLGVVLNKADSRKMKFYRAYGSPEYYATRYESYYHS